MKHPQEIAQRLWNRMANAQHRIQKLLIQKADALGLVLLSIDMFILMRENELMALANILPKSRPQIGQMVDFALLYLDLPAYGIRAGFYKLQLSNDSHAPKALLLDTDNQVIGSTKYFGIDVFAGIAGSKNMPAQKLPIIETFNKTNDTFVLGGTHADGQAFVITLDL